MEGDSTELTYFNIEAFYRREGEEEDGDEDGVVVRAK